MPIGQPIAVPSNGMPLKNVLRCQPASPASHAVPNTAKVSRNRPWIV